MNDRAWTLHGALVRAREALGPIGGLVFFFLGLGLVASGSFALEAWTGLPDWATVGIMLVLAVFVPPAAGLLGLIGLAYLPFW